MSGLWIRSQDKEILILANHLDIYNATLVDDDEETWCIEESGTDIGEYKSKERALEVLDEIQTEVTEYLGTHAEMVYEMPEE